MARTIQRTWRAGRELSNTLGTLFVEHNTSVNITNGILTRFQWLVVYGATPYTTLEIGDRDTGLLRIVVGTQGGRDRAFREWRKGTEEMFRE